MNRLKFIVNAYDINDLAKLKKAGASAIVLSNPFYSARGAFYVDVDELASYKKECDELALACYVQVNRFFVEDELPQLEQHLHFLKELEIDGIYFSDEAVLQIAKSIRLEDKLIYNPDTLMTNANDVQFYLNDGIQMVTMSKEITLEEICQIASSCDAHKLEVVIHGRLNMMHSKRPLISNYLTFIGSDKSIKNHMNLYMMEETREEHMPIIEDELGTHAFSGFTLNSFKEIEQLRSSGIEHVRIEGIFHDLDYTLEALRLYRSILKHEIQADKVLDDYQKEHMNDHVTSGFYYQKTSKTK